MKKILVSLFAAAASLATAQPYGEWAYHEHDIPMSSASYNVIIPGHLMAGYFVAPSPHQGLFKLVKVDANGAVIFKEQYSVFAKSSCGVSPPLASAKNISAIETSSSTDPYAVAGSVPDGCFFATFNASGVPQIMKYFTFPMFGTMPSQPSLLEIPAGLGGGFLVTGSYTVTGWGRQMFILKLDANGNLMQSSSYNSSLGMWPPCSHHGYELEPYSMIISPYVPTPSGQTEIIVVGNANAFGDPPCAPSVAHSNAFFMRINFASLNWISNKLYSKNNGTAMESNVFRSITPTTFAGNGCFLIGGHFDAGPSVPEKAWMTVIDQSGSLHWSYLYKSSFSMTRECAQVVSRISSTYGPTNYGAVVSLSAGMLCFKVNEFGMPFSSTTPVDNYNEFNYQSGHNGFSYLDYQSHNMSVEPNTGSSEGIHIYGTAEFPDNWYMVKASFNGVSGPSTTKCSTSVVNNQLSAILGPNVVVSVGVNQIPGPSNCSQSSLVISTNSTITNPICVTTVPGANNSNNRPTSITENLQASLVVSPNPAQNQIRIVTPNAVTIQTLRMTDLSGRVVAEIPKHAVNESILIYDLDRNLIPDGIYFIEAETVSGKLISKLVVQRN